MIDVVVGLTISKISQKMWAKVVDLCVVCERKTDAWGRVILVLLGVCLYEYPHA